MLFIRQTAGDIYKIKIKAANPLGRTEAQRMVILRDGEDTGDTLLDVNARIGELLTGF